jgi:hypothetical protein
VSGACNTHVGNGKCLKHFRRKITREENPWRDRGADETEIGREGVDWIQWVQDEIQCWAFVRMVTNRFHKRQRVS